MDELFSIIWAAIHWRFLLGIFISIGTALFLSDTFESFTSEYCVSLAGLGLLIGIYWQGKSRLNNGNLTITYIDIF